MEKFIHDEYTLTAMKLVREGKSFFITGKAGTGKTRLLGEIVRESRARGKNIVVAAPTGVAAKNAEGQTLHSLFGLKTITYIPGKTRNWYHLDTAKERVIRKLDILIIDEISMVRCDVLDMVDQTLKKVRWSGSAFGGIQVIFFGDLFQLPPVVEDDDEELLYSHYEKDNPYFFSSDVIRKRPLPLLELEKVHRQKDERFVRILNNVREGKILSGDIEAINRRFKDGYEPSISEPAIYLRTRKYNVWKHNDSKLKELPGEKFTSTAEIEGYFPKRLFPTDEELALKVGAKVMLLRNDNDGYEYVNGTLGIVKSIYGGVVRVLTQEGKLISVEKSAWTLYKYEYDERNKIIKPFPVGSFTQYPIKLAWAVTIHKSQGLTFDKVIIDAHRSFASGQVYVALSRCRSLKGIVLTTRVSKDDIKLDPIIVDYMKSVERIKPDLTLQSQELEEIFLFDDDEKTITGIVSEFSGNVEIHEGVEKIADKAFKDNTEITEVVCPKSLREIGDYAFKGCANLQKIYLNEGLESIGMDAFIDTGLKEIVLPSTLSDISLTPFECKMNVNVLNDDFSSDDGVLYNEDKTTLILYPRKVIQKKIEITDSVTRIEAYAFENNEAEEIVIPEDIEELENDIFSGCENLKTLTIKEGYPKLINIKDETFDGFEIEDCVLRVPFDSLSDYMEDERFKDFKYITAIEGSRCLRYDENGTVITGYDDDGTEDIIIPEGVTSIKEEAFCDNEDIVSVVFPESLETIHHSAFSGCSNLSDIELKSGLETIKWDAFKGTALPDVNIPDTVKEIDCTAFSCEMEVDAQNVDYCAYDGVLYSFNESKLVIYPSDKTNDEFVVPETVSIIHHFAFEDSSLHTLYIHEDVDEIGQAFIGGCEKLTKLTIDIENPDSVQFHEKAFANFNKKQCTLYVPYGCRQTYLSNDLFQGFKSITELQSDDDYVTGQFFESLPSYSYSESKPFCFIDGKYRFYIVSTKDGFFLRKVGVGYYFLSDHVRSDKTGAIWVHNKKEKAASYDFSYTTDKETRTRVGHFDENYIKKALTYKDYQSGKTFTIDLK